ncbi:hypothetical protein [Halanaerobacter jeridensis]|uniref:Uncharacterized protein n=1 Tax=Halanaerobacter jeridensis TaxID=706427 RepID=A0A938XWM8_9FIRM|nr:hypothetical protein [Halanaerobacter jeridensis]MBM7558169.1 hypothetical protein [Halanaerobacter jeridensis]
MLLEEERSDKKTKCNFLLRFNFIKKYYKNKKANIEEVNEIFRLLFTDEKFIENIIDLKPYLVLDLVDVDSWYKKDLLRAYLKKSLLNNRSILNKEIDNISMSSALSYTNYSQIEEDKRILYFIFKDIKFAENYEVYNPIGEAVEKRLKQLSRIDSDKFNFRYESNDDNLFYKYNIYRGVKFFDLMIYNSIFQELKWHMWLYYLCSFVKKICQNYDPDFTIVDRNDEFPTRYDYLLYEIISVLKKWIKSIKHLNDNYHTNINIDKLKHKNDNIIVSSIIAFGRVMKTIINSNLTDKFKEYMLGIYFELYIDLMESEKEKVGELMLIGISYGGTELNSIDSDYLNFIIRFSLGYDKIRFSICRDKIINKLVNVFLKDNNLNDFMEPIIWKKENDKVKINCMWNNFDSITVDIEE